MSEDGPRERRGEAGGRGQRTRRGPGLASALAGASLLVVLGFALGVVGGLVLEEPDLLLDYVLGRTEQVSVAEVEPDVAARPPEAAAPPPEAAAEASLAEAAPAPPVEEWTEAPAPPEPVAAASEELEEPVAVAAAVPPVGGGFAVQVGAFAEAGAAEQLARRLRERGHPVYVAPSAGADAARWRVRVGPLSSRSEAEAVAARLEREDRVSTWVLAEGSH